MKKRFIILVLALCCTAVLSGCFCKHASWNDATCLAPRTCPDCGETEGEALGHVWMAATCEEPKTCEQCGETQGEAKGHDMTTATCTESEHCTRCDLVTAEALGHDWQEATTEVPKTCATCSETEGERIVTDPRFTTAATKELHGKWGYEIAMTGDMLGIENMEQPLVMQYIMDFGKDGSMGMYVQIPDEAAFLDLILDISVESAYLELEAEGFTREEGDALFLEAYGMGVEDYLRMAMEEFSINDLLADIIGSVDVSGVYYVEDGILYTGITWEGKMDEDKYILDGDNLTIPSFSAEMGEDAVLKRIPD